MPNYYLVACGTSKSDYPKVYPHLEKVPNDLSRVNDILTSHFDYTRVLECLSLNPSADSIKKEFAEWLISGECTAEDFIIFYYSGHGEFLQGDRHCLILEKTKPTIVGQTSLPTDELIRPLQNLGVTLSQILFIIDTCYSGEGAGDITQYATRVKQRFQSVAGENVAIHVITACRSKQTALDGAFTPALEAVLQGNIAQESSTYINPNELVDRINKHLDLSKHRVQYNCIGSETVAKFFPVLSKSLQDWEKERDSLILELMAIFNQNLDKNLLLINSYLLVSPFIDSFVIDGSDLQKTLNELSIRPIAEGVCPLIALSEWGIHLISRRGRLFDRNLVPQLEIWQQKAIELRSGVELLQIKESVRTLFECIRTILTQEVLRLQIVIEPEQEQEKNTGQPTGSLLLSMNLWVESQSTPIGRFAEKQHLPTRDIGDKVSSLTQCLEVDNLLADMVHKARYFITDCFGKEVLIQLECFLPFEYFETSLDSLTFRRGRQTRLLGNQYPLFINSYERYFDPDFQEIRSDLFHKKRELWMGDESEVQVCPEVNHGSEDLDQFEPFDLYVGTSPSMSVLEMIELSLPIAVWSRVDSQPLVLDRDLQQAEWKDWPEKVNQYRKANKKAEITLFWDDLYPKPSDHTRPLDPSVVE